VAATADSRRRHNNEVCAVLWLQSTSFHSDASARKKHCIVKAEDVAQLRSTLDPDSVVERTGTVDSTLARAVARTAATLRRWMIHLETESGHEEYRSLNKPYVGLHTPDSDAVGIRTEALPQFVGPTVGLTRSRWG
jgi:hypothetical protein